MNDLPILTIKSPSGCPILSQTKFEQFLYHNWWASGTFCIIIGVYILTNGVLEIQNIKLVVNLLSLFWILAYTLINLLLSNVNA